MNMVNRLNLIYEILHFMQWWTTLFRIQIIFFRTESNKLKVVLVLVVLITVVVVMLVLVMVVLVTVVLVMVVLIIVVLTAHNGGTGHVGVLAMVGC